MSWFSEIAFSVNSLFLKKKLEKQMSDEIRIHLEMEAEAKIAAGMSSEEARYAAQREFGNAINIREQIRDERGWVWPDNIIRDTLHAGRMLRKNPGFTATAVISLALCLGANVAIFSMLNALVIRPLPYSNPERIVEVYNSFPKAGMNKLFSNLAQYFDFKQHTNVFAELGLWRLDEYTIGDAAGPNRVTGAAITKEMFDVLGVKPLLGQFFTAANHVPGADKVIVLTHSFWKSQFQGDPHVLGGTLRVDGAVYEIIGVAPPLFEAFDARVKFVRPLSWSPDEVAKFGRSGYSPQLFGRLMPGATVGVAYEQVAALEKQYYDSASAGTRQFYDRTGHVIKVDTVQSQRVGSVKGALYLLEGAALFVLLIGCVNFANLLLARANARKPELATRVALGASRVAIARQMLVESTLITWGAAIFGLAFAWLALGAMNHFTAQLMPDARPLALDGHLLGVMALFVTCLALAIGLLPIMHVLRGDLLDQLHRRGRGTAGGREVRAMSNVLIVAQVAVALILLTGAGVLIRSFGKVIAVDPGFDPKRVVTARIALPGEYDKDNQVGLFKQRLETMLQEIPDVTASLATATPFLLIPQVHVSMPIEAVTLHAPEFPGGQIQTDAYGSGASPAYLKTMHIPLLEGRWFSPLDTEQSRRVVVVDEEYARRYFSARSAIGQRLKATGDRPLKGEDWSEIIGVVGHARHNGLEDNSGNPFFYRPFAQAGLIDHELSVLIRTERPTAEVIKLLRGKVAAIDPTLPVFAVEPLETVISDSFSNRRAIMWLISSFGAIALLLSAVGIHGVLAYDVSQRTREIGIRGALGATRVQIAGLVVRQALLKTGIGVALGLAGAVLLSRYLRGLLFEVKPIDPIVYGCMTFLLIMVAVLASWLPARGAAKVDPVITLRAE